MDHSIFLGLLQNTAILLAFGLLYDYFYAKKDTSRNLGYKIIAGIIIGATGVILILTPWTLVPGLVFDTRSILLSVSGLFFGPLPTLIAMAMTAGYRALLGGDGMWMGIAVILTSGSIGILWRIFRPFWRKRSILELLYLGLTVHFVMLCCTLLLPSAVFWPTLKIIAFPVIIIYPAGTVLLGALMIKFSQNWMTQNALQQSEERWNYALEGAGDGVWDWNPQTNEIYYSGQWKAMLGYRDEEIENAIDTWESLIHPDDKESAFDELSKHLAGQTDAYTSIHRLRCKDGSYKWILDRGKVMSRDSDGSPTRFIGTHTDISDRKQVEEALSLAKEKAEESDRLKTSFLNNISHEVRTPLNAIKGFTSFLSDDITEEETARFVQIIQTNADHLVKIIDDVLEFSRLESEKIEIELSPFSIKELMDELFDEMNPQAVAKRLTLKVLIGKSGESDIMIGDKSRIHQVLSCFISNALKYTMKGSIELTATIKKDSVLFSVRDTGIGINSEDITKVFDRFYRAPAVQQMAISGTGLGLSIALQLVEIMNGKIGAQSLQPHGTEFYADIPMTPVYLPSIPKEEVPGSHELKDLHVLIAEDEEDNYEFIRILLERKVARITHAANGMEALEIFEKEFPDMILLDLKMPVMDGYNVCREIRKSNKQIPIIALTAYSQPEEKKMALEAGCTLFISKPIDKEQLFREMKRALSK